MALFRRRRREGEDKVGRRVVVTDDLGIVDDGFEEELLDEPEAAPGETAAPVVDEPPATPRAQAGPFDRSEVDEEVGDRLDLGGLWLAAVNGARLRIEIDQNTGDVQAVTTDLDDSSMQVQAFAAPKTSGIWRTVRTELADSVVARGGAAEVQQGPLGTELLTRLPSRGPDGRTVYQVMRFIGVDGPRWFLRAVLTGPAAADDAAAEPFYEMIRGTVVVRGDDARPPREMLPLRLPKELTEQPAQEPEPPTRADDLNPFERGPEITEVH